MHSTDSNNSRIDFLIINNGSHLLIITIAVRIKHFILLSAEIKAIAVKGQLINLKHAFPDSLVYHLKKLFTFMQKKFLFDNIKIWGNTLN